jgi:hypothetical protein
MKVPELLVASSIAAASAAGHIAEKLKPPPSIN